MLVKKLNKNLIIAWLVTIILLAGVVTLGCTEKKPAPTTTPTSLTPPTPSPTPALPVPTPQIAPGPPIPPQPPPLKLNITSTQPFYLPEEEVRIELTFYNTGLKPITISPFPPEIRLVHYKPYEIIRSFTPGDGELKLEPGEILTYLLKWDQRDDSGHQVNPGYYHLEMMNINVEGPEGGWGISAITQGKVLIQFPQGALEKTIAVNQSRTANDVTVTLERVELTATGSKVQALLQIPDITPSETPTPPPPIPTPEPTPPPGIYPVSAWYKVDNGPEREPYSPGFRWVEGGIRITWIFDPIPSDAREMTFAISKVGEQTGPWEFQISLVD